MIHIITFVNTYNYGSVLQAYALNKYINSNICEAKTIYFDLSSFSNMKLNEYLKKQLIKYMFYKDYRKKRRKFVNFIEEYIHLESKKFNSFKSLQKYHFNKNDIYIVGSDQCWCELERDAFFLDFVDSKNKYTYALSLGDNDISKNEFKYIENKTQNFKSLSFREKYSSKQYFEITKKKSNVHIDPTFLLLERDYDNILQKSMFSDRNLGDYVLVYCIRSNKKMNEYIKHLLAKKTKIILIGGMVNKLDTKEVKYYRDLGIEDFLYLVKYAKEIVADSFHAIVFSIIFKKQFKAFVHKRKNTRIENLLSMFDLNERIVKDDFNISDIDYSQDKFIFENLDIVHESKRYLKNILK